jgi:saccharopine dehydrogenase (NAD+, L-lysine forming)
MIKIGVVCEGKVPPDERVPLVPIQIKQLLELHSSLDIKVQKSKVRRISDDEYLKQGISVVDSVEDQDILIGVKEVRKQDLIPNKTYFFFSHTIKKQPYNKELLQAVVEKKIRLIDWECLSDTAGRRLIGFGRYAGVVGTYNAFRAFGLRNKSFELTKAHDCHGREEMESELVKAMLPPIKILLTGRGKVAKGSIEILEKMNIRKVGKRDFMNVSFDEPVYCQISFQDYFKRKDGGEFETAEFYKNPGDHVSDFMRFARVADVYIAGHFWGAGSPLIFSREDARRPEFNISIVADISCDIDGPVASTIRPSTIADPLYGYDPINEIETSYDATGVITVMAVDNLPCELPRDASFDFGKMFIKSVLPSLLNGGKNGFLNRASITDENGITDRYAYLRDWINS